MVEIVIYTKAAGEEFCPHCENAKGWLRAREIPYTEKQLTADERPAFYDTWALVEGQRTMPQVFLHHSAGDIVRIGGYEDLQKSGVASFFVDVEQPHERYGALPKDRWYPNTESARMAHVVEEMGEVLIHIGGVLKAAGKIGRFGPLSKNPTLPPEQQVPNAQLFLNGLQGLRSEREDMNAAIDRFLPDLLYTLGLGPKPGSEKRKTLEE